MITIIVLYIFLGLIAFIVILLHFSVKILVTAKTGSEPEIKAKYLFLTLYPRKPKEKTSDRKNNDDKYKSEYSDEDIEELIKQAEELDNEKTEEEGISQELKSLAEKENQESIASEKPPEKPPKKVKVKKKKTEKKQKSKLDEIKKMWAKYKPYVPMAWKYFKKLLKAIRFNKVSITLTSGKEDAYESAMRYGKLNGALFNGLAVLGSIFTVKAKKAQVDCKFNVDVFEYDVSTVIMVRPSTMLAIMFCIGVNFLKIWYGGKLKARRERKRREKENKANNQNLKEELLTNE